MPVPCNQLRPADKEGKHCLSMLLKHAESYQHTRELPCKAGLVLLEMVPALVQPVGLQGQTGTLYPGYLCPPHCRKGTLHLNSQS